MEALEGGNEEEALIRVANTTSFQDLGYRLAREHEEGRRNLRLSAAGAASVYTAVKGIIMANQHLIVRGEVFDFFPSFKEAEDGLKLVVLSLRARKVT